MSTMGVTCGTSRQRLYFFDTIKADMWRLCHLKMSGQVKKTFFERAWPDDVLVILLRAWAKAGEYVAATRSSRKKELKDKKKKLTDTVKTCGVYDMDYRHQFGDESSYGPLHRSRVVNGIVGKCGCDGKNCPIAFIINPLPPLGIQTFGATRERGELSAIVPTGDTYVAKWIRDSVEQRHMHFVPV